MTKISLLFFLLILTTSYAQENNEIALLNIEAILKPTLLDKNKDLDSELKKEKKKKFSNEVNTHFILPQKEKMVRKYRESNREPRYDMF